MLGPKSFLNPFLLLLQNSIISCVVSSNYFSNLKQENHLKELNRYLVIGHLQALTVNPFSNSSVFMSLIVKCTKNSADALSNINVCFLIEKKKKEGQNKPHKIHILSLW